MPSPQPYPEVERGSKSEIRLVSLKRLYRSFRFRGFVDRVFSHSERSTKSHKTPNCLSKVLAITVGDPFAEF
jgi:hypothetical protein